MLYAEPAWRRDIKITQPSEAYEFFRSRIATDIEEFWVAALNANKAVVASQCLFRGTVDSCLFHPRDVFRFGCRHNASSLIVAHSHPSGRREPSLEDDIATSQLLAGAEILSIPMIDHLIITGANYYSFLERGRLNRLRNLGPSY